ncbi:hypothetical protein BDP27DRAFT_1370635 [Rhodocollybia butyracea]|uniref:Uncharacterized protein n=1 Tax=Rhodocollybia butyracea TaxID=206335 RepID=A0A9P5P7I0_9AGAR|nr:hypothetical protein BDP27DRAFT_1370635 [Rhodocollybia butyracea]
MYAFKPLTFSSTYVSMSVVLGPVNTHAALTTHGVHGRIYVPTQPAIDIADLFMKNTMAERATLELTALFRSANGLCGSLAAKISMELYQLGKIKYRTPGQCQDSAPFRLFKPPAAA